MRPALRLTFALVATGSVVLGTGFALQARQEAAQGMHHARAAMERNLVKTLIPAPADAPPLRTPELRSTHGEALDARLRDRWSLVYFGFTHCPHVCPTTLATLKSVAADPAAGFADGSTQVLFVTVDPARDDLPRLRTYLAAFDARFVGYTGSATDLEATMGALGAAYSPGAERGFDHSTSLFVVAPDGRPAGVLLRPTDPARIVADLTTLREAGPGTAPPAARP